MDRQETIGILAAIKAAYPSAFKDVDAEATARVWHRSLQDLDTGLVATAVDALISRSKFAPAISEIREMVLDITSPAQISADEAWKILQKNMSKYGYYRMHEGKMALPIQIREAVDVFGYVNICNAENIDVIRGQFIKIYNAKMEREKKDAMLPAQLRETIGQISQKMLPADGVCAPVIWAKLREED